MARLVPDTGGSLGLLRKAAAVFALILLLGAGSAVAQAQTASTFVDLVDGSDIDTGQPFRWTAEPDALAYYLYVGTAPGLKDVVNSRETQATQWPSGELPIGVTLHARIHTKYASGWVNSSVSFTVRPVAVFTSPSNSNVTSQVRLQWSSVPGAEAYFLYVGSAPGLKDFVSTGETPATSYDVQGLPVDRPAYARLHTKHGGTWRYVDLTLNVLSASTFIAPLDGDQQFAPSAEIHWRAVEGAQAYYLYVGTAPGRKDLIDSRETQATRWPATFIPTAQTVYARLHTKVKGDWRYSDISFRLAPQAVFIEPGTDGAELDPRMALMWTDVPSAQAYYLYIGTVPAQKDVHDSNETSALSFDVESLPRGSLFHATLHTKAENTWRATQRSFRVTPVAVLRARTDTPSRIDTRIPARWDAVEGAEAYYLYVGSTPGAKDLINSREIHALEFPIDSLPAGRTVYVRLHTKHGGVWRFVDATWNTRPVAYLEGSVAASGIWAPATPLTWEPLAGANRYYVYVGSTPGSKDLSSSGEISGTEFTMPAHHAAAIGHDSTVYVRLHTLVDGRWESVDYTVQFRVASQLAYPKNGATNVDVSALRFTWNDIAGSTRYRLQLGKTAGGADLLDTDTISSLERRMGALPGGVTIHARLWTEIAGEWRFSDAKFTTRPASAFVYPLHGDLVADLSSAIQWTPIAGAEGYRVEIGSSAGASDLLNISYTNDTSVPASSALAAAVGTIYARIWTRRAGTWRFSDSVFMKSSDPQPASMTWLTSANTFHASDAFRWTDAGPLADGYRLQLGSTPGGNNLHNSAVIKSLRRLVPDLPVNTPLYGSIETTFFDGTVVTTQFQFSVEDATIGYEDRWNQALWATAEVRGMAKSGNFALPYTLLLDMTRIQQRDSANCTTYAMTMAELTRQINLGLDVRTLNTCLNDNSIDCHTLLEVLNPHSGRWQILDPTFGIALRRGSDGEWATSFDMFAAVRDAAFGTIQYVPLTERGLSVLESYYIDYPLLFAQVYAPGSSGFAAQVESILPYYEMTGLREVSSTGFYAIHCLSTSNSASIKVTGSGGALPVDGSGVALVPCSSKSGLSRVFSATSIEAIDGTSAYEIAIPRRYDFN